jgi:hypothetical protein
MVWETTLGVERGFADRPTGLEVLRRWREAGGTSVETYLRWVDVEPERGRWDWSVFDRDLDALAALGLRWVPFVILGPWYATPAWFRQGPDSLCAVCLEHGRPSGNQSIWNPRLWPWVERFLAAFGERYGAALRRGGAVESVLLGISGDYGEAIQTVTGNWPGAYHGHRGYWCGDPEARAAFRRWVQARYGTLDALARAWGAPAPASWDAVAPPARPDPDRPHAWLDFVAWYRGEMTGWAARWLGAARRLWPEVALYLCTGGDMHPAHGSDFSDQCRVAAAAGAGVRITNEGSDYLENLVLTRLVATAGRHEGAYVGLEPAAAVDARGVAARQFHALGSGARQLHEYQGNLWEEGPHGVRERGEAASRWRAGAALLRPCRPVWRVAVAVSLPDLALREIGLPEAVRALARALRPATDFALVDDHLVRRGALRGIRAVFLAPARVWDPETLAHLEAFVADGGLAVASQVPPEGGRLFGFHGETEALTGISPVVPAPGVRLPATEPYLPFPLGQSFRALAPDAVPLLWTAYEPPTGGRPWVLWYRRHGRGAAAFYAGAFALGDGWMARPGLATALAVDVLTRLAADLGLDPVVEPSSAPVLETELTDGWIGWNPGDAPASWRGQTLGSWSLGAAPKA